MSDFNVGEIDWERGAFAPVINKAPGAPEDSLVVSETCDISTVGRHIGSRTIFIATDGGVFENVPYVEPKQNNWLNWPA